MRRDCMNWNSIYMTPKGYPAPPDFAKAKQQEYPQSLNVAEAEDLQFEEAIQQV